MKQAELALRQAKDNLAKANEELHRRVREGTANRERAKIGLLKDLKKQKRLEIETRQAQKMESMGTLKIAKRESSGAKAADYRETVFLAEDEEQMVRLLKRVLFQRGYRVLVAVDGEEAVDLFSRYKPEIDVVLMDIGLPKLRVGM